jgi:hypothetical protein
LADNQDQRLEVERQKRRRCCGLKLARQVRRKVPTLKNYAPAIYASAVGAIPGIGAISIWCVANGFSEDTI